MSRPSGHQPGESEHPLSAQILYVPLAFTFALVAVASFLPDKRLWGINHLAFYPVPIRLGTLGLIALSFVPGVARGLNSLLKAGIERLAAHSRRVVWVSIIIAIVATTIFVGFQSSTLLLGDGKLVADNFKHTFLSDTTMVTNNPLWILKGESIAKGATLLYYWFTKASFTVFSWPPLKAMRILNCLLGGILVLVFMRIPFKSWLATVALTSGTIELFFGYVENYTALMLFAVLYAVSGFILIQRKCATWLFAALACLVLGTFMHIQGILLAPSFALLLIWFLTYKRRKHVLTVVSPLLIALVLIGTYVAGALPGQGEHLLPVRASAGSTGILSSSHWLDVFNELLLLLPMFPVFVFMTVALMRSRRYVEEHFALHLLVPCLLFLMVFDPKLGMARDWDLFTITSVGLISLAMLMAKRFLSRCRRSALSLVTTPVIVMSAALAVSWIGINSSEEKSTRRYESILSYDTTFGQYAYETLAKQYHDGHRLKEAITAMEKAVSFSYNSRLYILLSVYYRDDGQLVNAAGMLRPVLEHEPLNERVRSEMALILFRSQHYEELFDLAREGTEYHPDNPVFHAFYGKMLIALGRIEEGAEELLYLKRLNPPEEMAEDVDRILKQLRDEGKL
ncbi:MAG: hypothetical protein ABIJ00_11480 [Candidatus Eisenbacteria bacterium]